MSIDSKDGSLGYETCPKCGAPGFYHDSKAGRHICIHEECGYVVDDYGDSIDSWSGGGGGLGERAGKLFGIDVFPELPPF